MRQREREAEDEGHRPGGDRLPRELQDLGLSPYESRVLMSLLQLGSATTLQIAQFSAVPRTSTYQVLEALGAKRLAYRIPGDGPAVWSAAGRDEIFAQLEAQLEAQNQARMRDHQAKADEVRDLLRQSLPEAPIAASPFVHLIHGRAQTKLAYERIMAEAAFEFLVFNRPPYSWAPGAVNEAIVHNVQRGVRTRALYQAVQLDEPGWHALRSDIEAYHAAGVDGRVVDELPLKMVIADRSVAMIALPNPEEPEDGFPTNLLIEHAGFASLLAALFDMVWASARTYQPARQTAEFG